jgi:hypothetical protein
MNGATLYRGASLIDGAPIVVIATGLDRTSRNQKTGALVQTYIMRADVEPTAAIKTGADASICGDCAHRGDGTGKARTCYVNVGQGPLRVFRTAHHGATGYPFASDVAALGEGRAVRIGTYGDPAAVPVHVWEALISRATGHTGYTHQWRRAPQLRPIVMASVDSEAEAREAQSQGWRTFRVCMPNHALRLPGEAQCPASAEMGKKLTCAECLACNGANGRRGSIVIQAHGGFAVMANIAKRSDSLTLN